MCYSHEDRGAVYPEIAALRADGLNLWYDEGISGGRAWRAEVANAVRGASRFLFYISENSLTSIHCRQEVEYALDNQLAIVPVYLDNSTLPPELQLALNRLQALFKYNDGDYAQHLRDALRQSGVGSRPTVSSVRNTRNSPVKWLAVVFLVLLSLAFLLLQRLPESEHIEPGSIAVLPLRNIDGSERTQIFSSGLTEDVTNRLARIPGMQVSSWQDSSTLPPDASSEEVRERLRVKFYIGGSVRVSGSQIRVVIRLNDAVTGVQLQSRRFDRQSEDFFTIQDEITRLAIASLRIALPENAQDLMNVADTDINIDAYVLYRRGMNQLFLPTTRETLLSAMDWFDKAVREDTDYAAAHAGACRAHTLAFIHLDEPDRIDAAESSCQRALSLSPNLPIVHNALGDLYLAVGKLGPAAAAYRSALDFDENNAIALLGLANVYTQLKRADDAERVYRRAIVVQPGNWRSYNDLGWFYFQNGRYAEAAEAYREVVELDRSNFQGWSNLASALMLSGDFESAAPAFARSIEIDPQAHAYTSLGLMHYYLDDLDSAIVALTQATKLSPGDHLVWANLGDALWHSGETEKARQAFTEALGICQRLLEINPKDSEAMIDMAWSYAMLDEPDLARSLMEEASLLTPDDPYLHYIGGLILARQGKIDAALDSLSNAVNFGYPLVMLKAEPHLRILKDQPAFQSLTNSG